MAMDEAGLNRVIGHNILYLTSIILTQNALKIR